MIQKLIKRALHHRHYWRRMKFDELSELYASRVIRVMALTMVSVFVAIFLYQNGYSLTAISLFFAFYCALRAAFAFPSAHIVARVGPKHATLISNIASVPALLGLATLETQGFAAILCYVIFQCFSVSLYTIAYHTEFSKVKHRSHSGKEIGYMFALERIAMAVSPLLGGFIAFVVSPVATIIAAAILYALAAAPLFYTGEPIRIHQKISFKYIPWARVYRSLISEAAGGWDFTATGIVWSLFVAIAIFGTGSDVVYAQIGAVSSLAIIASVLTARMYGKIVDRHRGGELLRFGVAITSLMHVVRPFISTPSGVALANLTTEAGKSAYYMPFLKGVFDLADNLPGHRIVYMALIEISFSIGGALALLTLAYITLWLPNIASMQLFYFVSGLVSLLLLNHGLRALRIVR